MARLGRFALGFALMAAYWPGIAGAATAPRWIVGAAMAGALFLAPGRTGRAGIAIDAIGALLLAWLVASLAWSAAPLDGLDTALKLVVVVAAFLFGRESTNIRPFVAGAAIGLMPSSVVAIAQWNGNYFVEAYGEVGGLFYNGDRLAAAAALVAAAALGLRMWWALPGLVPALILPLSRAAWIALAASLIVFAWQRGRTFDRFMVLAILGQLGLLAVMLGPQWWPDSNTERWTIWTWTATHLDLPGHGLGSFAANPMILPGHGTTTHPEHPHSEWLWLAYEGGVVALALCGALAVLLWRAATDALRLVLVGLLVLSAFAMPWHDPGTVLFAAVVAGALARGRGDVRDAAGDGRVALCAGHAAAPAG